MAAATNSTTGGADLISSLPDDVLLHILELLPDAGDAACTGVLSRRWRGLWTRLPALRFDSGSGRPELSLEFNGPRRFVAMVNDSLALRAAAQTEPAFQHLTISGWIRHAVRNEVRSLVLELDRPSLYKYYARVFATTFAATNKGNKKEQRFVVALEDLPSSSKMETMRLALDGAAVRLPAAATFAALVDLSLENMEFTGVNGQLLNRLLSSACCPSLRKVSLRELGFNGQDELFVVADTLLELSMEKLMWKSDILRLRTPSLRVLRVVACSLDELVLSAPRLEELQFVDDQPFSKIHNFT
ncbi:unnamed protein product [Urochloa decumbens]|uniref:F-box domain-containing protein n=1 Tax=Urochloa decumbens TaxID=240449 RepID=A0ABC9F5J1_9POAL